MRDQLKEKDAKINSLVEELGNSQAMLNDKVAELAEVLSLLYHNGFCPFIFCWCTVALLCILTTATCTML